MSKEKGPKSWRGVRGIVGWGWRGGGYSLIWPNRVYTRSVDLTDYKVVILCNISNRVYLGTESHERMWKFPKCSSYVDMILVAPKITCFILSRDYKRLLTALVARRSIPSPLANFNCPPSPPPRVHFSISFLGIPPLRMIIHRRLLGHITLQSTPTKIEWSLLTAAFKIPSLYRLLIYWKGNTTGLLFHVLQVERLSTVIYPKLEDPIINNL